MREKIPNDTYVTHIYKNKSNRLLIISLKNDESSTHVSC